MHLVLSGYYGFHNSGDEAILRSIIEQLRELDPTIRLTVLSADPVHTSKTYQVEAVDRWKPSLVLRTLRKADGLLSGGGSLLQDVTGLPSLIYYTSIIQVAKCLGKPVFVYAQGMGPFQRKISRKVVKSVLGRNVKLTVRDEASSNLLKEIGIASPIEVVPDPVVGWMPPYVPKKDNVITVSVRDWPDSYTSFQELARTLDMFVNDGYEIVFVPMHGECDETCSTRIASMMRSESTILPSTLSTEDKQRVIGSSRLLIGMRLHALVFAAVSATPFATLSYDPKVDAFANTCRQPIAGHINQKDWDHLSLRETVLRSMELKPNITHLQEQAQATAAMATKYLQT
ncbi:polysaccharide pyruvyl transferase CsaB [Halobacillus salinus]|uniref:polysaccharide pyruvyl transferase CsaB n=1 Tax=Halobacillus salinus TaxID=192814 RepID=UPI0009A8393C|nr:polysaccharide pyruvyl transferase CsaB [Halobacillus salinus]